jgi:CRP-like cAMP-binding protein
MSSDAISVLRKSQLFAPLPPSELGLLLHGHQMVSFAAGDALFRHGDQADRLFLIVSGEALLSTGSNVGTMPVPTRLGPGETLGEEAVLTGLPHGATASATKPTQAIAIPASTLMNHLESNFETAITMISGMASLLRERVREITELKMQSTAERLASFLLTLAGAATGHITVRLPYEKRHLADHLGMDPATLSRAFAKLRDKGVVASRTDKVEIADVARLRSYGNGAAITH